MAPSRFFKLSGGGNDFIAFAEPVEEPSASEVRSLCRRGVSLGADGVFTLRRSQGAVRMRYWNADGSAASLCLNGTRCAATLAFRLGWAREHVTVETDAGPMAASAAGDSRISLGIPPPDEPPQPLSLEVKAGRFAGWFLTVGVPHFVVFPETDLDVLPVADIGRELRHAAALGPAGSNVDFAHCISASAFGIRSFERGVEAETLACGTGILAAAVAGVAAGKLQLPARALTRGGFDFEVGGRVDRSRIASWSLAGDARLLASGELDAGALRTLP